mgnify:FL=1
MGYLGTLKWAAIRPIQMAVACLGVVGYAAEGPCDIYAAAGTPCVTAHSTTRALFGNYTGNLYQVRRADGQLKDIPVERVGGYAKSSVQDEFCKGTSCTISILYDQTEYKNHLVKSPKVFWLKEGGKEANATAAPVYVNGRKLYGIYRTAWSAISYRNNATKGVATGDEEEAMYMVVNGKHYNDKCCFNYGNVETTGNDDGPGTMEAVYFGSDVEWGGYGQGEGPWIAADLEDGVFKGDDAGYLWGKTHTTPWPTAYSFKADFVTAMLKGPNNGTFQLKGADSNTDSLITVWDGKRKQGYHPRKLQGAVVMGSGGDGSDGGAGTFYEGAMTIGCPPAEVDAKIQRNIAAAGYGRTVEVLDSSALAVFKDTLEIPGTIQVEDYDKGGNGLSFNDVDVEHETTLYRSDNAGLDSAAGAYVYGWTSVGEWLRYTVKVKEAGDYNITARVASASESSSFSLLLDESTVAKVAVPNTGDWKTFEEVKGKVTLSAGTHVLKLRVEAAYFNIDWIKFEKPSADTTTNFVAPAVDFAKDVQHYSVFDIHGNKVTSFMANSGDFKNAWTEISSKMPFGIYLVQNAKSKKMLRMKSTSSK